MVVRKESRRRSAVPAWEVAIKIGLGRLRPKRTVEQAADEWIPRATSHHPHAQRVAFLPDHHRDPFDRLLGTQAELEELALVSRDPVFERYRVKTIAA